jgi:hypothetical protein
MTQSWMLGGPSVKVGNFVIGLHFVFVVKEWRCEWRGRFEYWNRYQFGPFYVLQLKESPVEWALREYDKMG